MPDDKNELQHNVFISWSGERSRHVATALAQLSALPGSETKLPPKRELADMVAEILDVSRAAARTGQVLQEQVSHVQNVLNHAPFPNLAAYAPWLTPGTYEVTPGSGFGKLLTGPIVGFKDLVDPEAQRNKEGKKDKKE